jgi:hypothetical protein
VVVEEVVVDDELVVVVELLLEDCTKCPTVIVTVLPLRAVEPPLGVWSTTFPSWLALVTFLVLRVTLNPAASSALVAPSAGSPTTGGTVPVGGAVATTIDTVLPGAAVAPPDGLWRITLPAFTVVELSVLALTLKPAFWSAEVA